MAELTPKALAEALTVLLQAKHPTCIWGSPGIGKSQIVAQVAGTLSLQLQDVRAVLLDPVDLRGLPTVTPDGHARWATPDFLPQSGAGVLFLDELNRAPMLT